MGILQLRVVHWNDLVACNFDCRIITCCYFLQHWKSENCFQLNRKQMNFQGLELDQKSDEVRTFIKTVTNINVFQGRSPAQDIEIYDITI